MGIKDKLAFAVNGRRFELSNIDPSTTLLEFLSTETPFKGAKLGSGEGSESFLDDGMGLVPSKWKGICRNNIEAGALRGHEKIFPMIGDVIMTLVDKEEGVRSMKNIKIKTTPLKEEYNT